MALRLSLSVCLFCLLDGGSYGYGYQTGPVDGYYGGVNSAGGSSSSQYLHGPGNLGDRPREQDGDVSPRSEEAPEMNSANGIQQAFYDSYKPDDRYMVPHYQRRSGHNDIQDFNTPTPVKMSSRTIVAPIAERPSNGNDRNWLRKTPHVVSELPEVLSNHQPDLPGVTDRPTQSHRASQTRWQMVRYGKPIPQYLSNHQGQKKSPIVNAQQRQIYSRQMLPKRTSRPGTRTFEESVNGDTQDLADVPTANPQGLEETLPFVPEQPEHASSTQTLRKTPPPVNRIPQDWWQWVRPGQTIPQFTGSHAQVMKSPSVPEQPEQVTSSQKLPEMTKRPTPQDRTPPPWWKIVKPGQTISQITGSHGQSPSVPEQPEQLVSSSQKLPEMAQRPTPKSSIPQKWWKLVKPGQTITQSTVHRQGQQAKEQELAEPQKWVQNLQPQDLVRDMKKPQTDDPPLVPYSGPPLSSIIQTHNSYERGRVVFSQTRYSPSDNAQVAEPVHKWVTGP